VETYSYRNTTKTRHAFKTTMRLPITPAGVPGLN